MTIQNRLRLFCFLLLIGLRTSASYEVTASTCGNGHCEPSETYANCSSDCTIPSCGTNGCEAGLGEDADSCPHDCPSILCGNSSCDRPAENEYNCPGDCATCDTGCASDETCNACLGYGLCDLSNYQCTCLPNYHPNGCSFDYECCSGICQYTDCVACGTEWANCEDDTQCCQGVCRDFQCRTVQ